MSKQKEHVLKKIEQNMPIIELTGLIHVLFFLDDWKHELFV